MQEQLENLAEDVFYIRHKFSPNYFTNIEFEDDDTIHAECERYSCSCCGPDYYGESFPVSYLWDHEWREKEREEQIRLNFEAIERKKREEEEKAETEKERRQKQYQKLKEEFENEEN